MRSMLVGLGLLAILQYASAQDVAESCRACHTGDLTLERWDASALTERLEAMRDGKVAHVVPIPALSDVEIAAVAAALVAD